jgi:MFS family permease
MDGADNGPNPTRPLGGLLIGAYADRAGRRPALMLTIGLMAIGTLGLVLTPSYASIGVSAPVILIIARLVQGLAPRASRSVPPVLSGLRCR